MPQEQNLLDATFASFLASFSTFARYASALFVSRASSSSEVSFLGMGFNGLGFVSYLSLDVFDLLR